MFANGSRDRGSVPESVIPKTKKMVLDAALLNAKHYKVCIKVKVEQSRERSSTQLHLSVVAIEKGAFPSPLTKGTNLPIFTHIHKRTHIYVSEYMFSPVCYILTLRPGLKMLFLGNTPEGSNTFQRPVIERDRVGGLRLMIWDKVKVPFCHYSHALEESNLWTAWQLFPLDDD